MSTSDLTTEEQRELHGWFGEPWPSGICYTEDGDISWATQKPTPVGEDCSWCDEAFVDGDQGSALPHLDGGGMTIRHVHRECMLRQVLGSIDHLRSGCSGDGWCHHVESSLTRREDALAVWEWAKQQPR